MTQLCYRLPHVGSFQATLLVMAAFDVVVGEHAPQVLRGVMH
jgi:hypothetical protein